jgi:hypothetical protein
VIIRTGALGFIDIGRKRVGKFHATHPTARL